MIVHLYEDRGPRCVERLNGMFAFALWDETRRELLLCARPLRQEAAVLRASSVTRLLFGSELKALLEHPRCPRELDVDSLCPLPRARVRADARIRSSTGSASCPGGHLLSLARGPSRRSSATGTSRSCDEPNATSDDEYVEEFRARFREAVRRRLMSDVPLGAFLSGGIDSSSVVAMMARRCPRGPSRRSRSDSASEASTSPSTHAASPQHFGDGAPRGRLHAARDARPAADGRRLPRRAVRRRVDSPDVPALALHARSTSPSRSAATGATSSSPATRRSPRIALRALYRVPHGLHERLVVPLVDRLPVSTDNFSVDFKLKRFLRGGGSAPEDFAIRRGSARSQPSEQGLPLLVAPTP